MKVKREGEEELAGRRGRGRRRRGGRRRGPSGHYGARFSILFEPGETRGDGESVPGLCAAGDEPMRPAPWPAASEFVGARGDDARGHEIDREMDGEGEENEARSPRRTVGGEDGSIDRTTCSGRGGLRRRFSPHCEREQAQSESEMGAGKCGLVTGAAKEGVGERARRSHDANVGTGLGSSCCKRGQRLGRALTSGPRLAEREEGEWGLSVAVGLGRKAGRVRGEGVGRGGKGWAWQAKTGRRGEQDFFFFLFFNSILQTHFQIGFQIILTFGF